MKKELSEMTLEELWKLFPIVLKEHSEDYQVWYEEEKTKILNIVKKEDIKRINHIGSSAVKGLIAKPTVDILLEIDGCCNITELICLLEIDGWTVMSKEFEPVSKIVLCKGYTPNGFGKKVYHLHVRFFGNWNELYFRDYLTVHTETATEYGRLKLELYKSLKNNRDGYTAAKSDFINKYSEIAKEEYQGRYRPK